MPQTLTVSVIQCSTGPTLSSTLIKLNTLTTLAKLRDNAQLVVFPEAFIGGYPKYSTFGTVVGDRTVEGREEWRRYWEGAIEIPSPTLTQIEQLSKSVGVFMVIGIVERAGGGGGTLYCTTVFIDPQKGYVGKHRKLVPTGMERVIWGSGDGGTMPVIEASFGGRVSAAICWENYMPLLRYHYYTLNTQLYCAPTVDSRPSWQHTMTHIALEGRCFVLSACQFSQEKDYAPTHPVLNPENRNPENVMIGGGSVIISPLGKTLAGPLEWGEGVLSAEIDLDECVRGKMDLDVVGHYARNDVFRFSANTGNE